MEVLCCSSVERDSNVLSVQLQASECPGSRLDSTLEQSNYEVIDPMGTIYSAAATKGSAFHPSQNPKAM